MPREPIPLPEKIETTVHHMLDAANRAMSTPESVSLWQRRLLGAVAGNVLLCSLIALHTLPEASGSLYAQPTAQVCELDECPLPTTTELPLLPGDRRAKTRVQSPLTLVSTTTTSTTILVTTTTIPEALSRPPQPTVAQRSASPEQLPPQYMDKIPTLDTLAAKYPDNIFFKYSAEQKAYIAQLNQEISITPEDFAAFTKDTSRKTAFSDVPEYHKTIPSPKAFVIHWSGERYLDGVDQLVSGMKKRHTRVAYFIDRSGKTYQLFENDTHFPAHAKGANTFSQGVEIETENFDPNNPNQRSPLFDYKPEQLKQAIMLAVDFCRRNKLPVNNQTIVGHFAMDLLYANSGYNRESGEITGGIGKFDPPQDLMNVLIVPHAQALDAALGPR